MHSIVKTAVIFLIQSFFSSSSSSCRRRPAASPPSYHGSRGTCKTCARLKNNNLSPESILHSPAQGDQDVPDDEDNGEEEENDIEQEVLVPGKAKIVHHSMQEQFQMVFFKKSYHAKSCTGDRMWFLPGWRMRNSSHHTARSRGLKSRYGTTTEGFF